MNPDSFYKRHSKLTRSLKKFISEQRPLLSPENFEAFLEALSESLSAARQDLQKAAPGMARARRLHSLVDQEISQAHQIEASCKKGCSACCHIEVEITTYETEILEDLVKRGHRIDEERLALQSARAVGDLQWKKSSQGPMNQCIFLGDDGDCSIYESRPVMCRRHSVTSPAILCSTLDAPITLRYFPRVDVLISAANEDPDLQVGPLAKMLYQKIRTP